MAGARESYRELCETLLNIKEEHDGGRFARGRTILAELLESVEHLSYRETDFSILCEFKTNLRGTVTLWQFFWEAKRALVGSTGGLQGRLFLKYSHPGPGKFQSFFEIDNRRRDGNFAPKGSCGSALDQLLRMQEIAADTWERPDCQAVSDLKLEMGLSSEGQPLDQEFIPASHTSLSEPHNRLELYSHLMQFAEEFDHDDDDVW